MHVNSVQPLVCKMVTRLLGEFKTLETAENHKIYVKSKNMEIEIINNNNIKDCIAILHNSQVCTKIMSLSVRPFSTGYRLIYVHHGVVLISFC